MPKNNTMKFLAPAPVQPAFAHPGGKRRLLKHILPHIPPHKVYVEPFCGAAAVLLAKATSSLEVINDIDGAMINFYNYSVHHREALLAELGKHLPQSSANFATLLRNPGVTDLQRAARWFILKVCSFGAQGETWGRDRRSFHGYDPARHNELINRLGDRLRRVIVESRDWLDVVNFYDSPETFFFFDPPYVNCTDTAYAAFTAEEMSAARERLDTMSGAWLLTCDDSAACRSIFAGLPALRMSIKYALGSRSATGGEAKESGELLIFEPSLAPAGIEKLPARKICFNAPATVKKRSFRAAA